MLKTAVVVLGNEVHRRKLDGLLQECKERVLEAYDRGEKVSVHLHQEEACFGHPELIFDMIYQGWTFGVSVGDYPKEAFLANRNSGEGRAKVLGKKQKREKAERHARFSGVATSGAQV